jgi:hypothetical protein
MSLGQIIEPVSSKLKPSSGVIAPVAKSPGKNFPGCSTNTLVTVAVAPSRHRSEICDWQHSPRLTPQNKTSRRKSYGF